MNLSLTLRNLSAALQYVSVVNPWFNHDHEVLAFFLTQWKEQRRMKQTQRTHRIPRIILLIESSRASGRAMLCGIASYAHHSGPWSFIWEPGGLERVWPMLKDLDADGIILRDVDQLNEVLAFGLPAIVVGHSRSEVPSLINVVTDSANIGRLAAEHLIHCGFKHFAYCGYRQLGNETTSWSAERGQHFSERISEAGIGMPSQFSLSMKGEVWANELQELSIWLKSLPKPVGLMACNDDCGRIITEACRLSGIDVPDMIGVIGADNDEVVCGLSDPPMSSVAIGFERAGYEAAHALHRLLKGEQPFSRRIHVVASHVVARRSTDVVAADDPHLEKALRFIRDTAKAGPSVNDVARSSGLSRRALEKRFRHLLGRSVLEEIRRVRTDQIGQLLVETDMSVAQIADLLGFADTQHVARYFRATKQLSPLAYRKAFGGRSRTLASAQIGGATT